MKLTIETTTNGYIFSVAEEEGCPARTHVVEDKDNEYLKLKNDEHLEVTDATNIRRLLWEVEETLGLFRGKHTNVRVKMILIDTEGKDVEAEGYLPSRG